MVGTIQFLIDEGLSLAAHQPNGEISDSGACGFMSLVCSLLISPKPAMVGPIPQISLPLLPPRLSGWIWNGVEGNLREETTGRGGFLLRGIVLGFNLLFWWEEGSKRIWEKGQEKPWWCLNGVSYKYFCFPGVHGLHLKMVQFLQWKKSICFYTRFLNEPGVWWTVTHKTSSHHMWFHAAAAAAKSLRPRPTLCGAMDSSPPGSSVHGTL